MDGFRRRAVSRAQQAAPVTKEAREAEAEIVPAVGAVGATPPLPPKRPLNPTGLAAKMVEAKQHEGSAEGVLNPATPQPIEPAGLQENSPRKKPFFKRKAFLWIVGVLIALLILIGSAIAWYLVQLSPVNAKNSDKKQVTIESGMTPDVIADTLKNEGLIRSTLAFGWYARFSGAQNAMQAGTYRLSPSETTPEIIDHLTNGTVDTFSITFLPGATLADDRQVFLDAGYAATEVDAAFAKIYDSPLFATKPASADLEGYIYGETYTFGANTSVEAILEHIFEQFYSVVEENNLVELYDKQGFTLYEGITLASIVQREASPAGDDMPEIAEVFYNRLASGMPLGSDVTYQYIADKTGVARDPGLDSPYNTRIYTGLPPGPISAPGKKALIAVANPAVGDYLYFLSGDDDVTYFGRTLEDHEANIANHCQEKCQIL